MHFRHHVYKDSYRLLCFCKSCVVIMRMLYQECYDNVKMLHSMQRISIHMHYFTSALQFIVLSLTAAAFLRT